MLLSLVKSSQEDVQERAATTIATFVVIDDETANVDAARSEAVMRDGGIPLLLDLARCSRVSAQSEAAKVINYLAELLGSQYLFAILFWYIIWSHWLCLCSGYCQPIGECEGCKGGCR